MRCRSTHRLYSESVRRPPTSLPSETPRGPGGSLPRQFGDFELLEEIARGAMGVVYRARQISLDRIVAIKLLLNEWFASEESSQRFRIEARASSGLQHPSIVPMHEIGDHEGQHYLCLAFVDGESLSAALEGGAMEPRTAAAIMGAVADGIQYAHEHDVLHRDIKPANILLDEKRHPWVTDFGLAKLVGEDSQATATGESVGTPSYMSPEQAAGEVVGIGPATDVYGIGATLYALITGRPPFIAPTAVATLRLVQERDPIPPRTLDPSIPVDLETICMRCMQKSARERYPSAGAVAEDLRRFQEGEPILARPVGRFERLWRRARSQPLVSGLVAALFLVACVSAVAVLTQWRLAVSALEAREEAEDLRVDAELEALATATPDAFAAICARLDLSDPRVLARLEAVSDDPLESNHRRFRARLAALPVRPQDLPAVIGQLVELGQEPQEFRLSLEALRTSLGSLEADARDREVRKLVDLVERTAAGTEARTLAAVALAACAPEQDAWRSAAADIATHLTTVDPFDLPAFAEPLRPFPRPLLEELRLLFDSEDESVRQASVSLLVAGGTQEPALLADLLPDTDDAQHTALSRALRPHAELVAERMRLALEEPAPPGALKLDSQLAPFEGRFRDAHGHLGNESAFALDMPVEVFRKTCAELKPFGFRPTRVRPAWRKGGLRVAAVLTRDGRAWHIDWEVESPQLDGDLESGSGLVPVDLASWVEPGPDGAVDRYVQTLAQADEGLVRWSLRPGQTASALVATAADLLDRGGQPRSLAIGRDAKGNMRADTVWHIGQEPGENEIPLVLRDPERAAYLSLDLCQHEVDAVPIRAEGEDVAFSGVFSVDAERESQLVWESTLEGHRAAIEPLLEERWRPVSVSVLWRDESPPTQLASVWQRPFRPVEERLATARRRARAGTTLALAGKLEEALPLLRSGPDPSLRFALAFDLARLGPGAEALLAALRAAEEEDVRFALLLALGVALGEDPSHPQRDALAALCRRWSQDDPDAGIHALSEWILIRLGERPSTAPAPADARWARGLEGHVLSIVEGPVDSIQGSSGRVTGRLATETPRYQRIERSFAIATKEVTNEQMTRFFEENPGRLRAIVTGEPSQAVEGRTWYDAVAYCRWLSELEGLPEEEMCYPPLDEIGPGMQLEDGHLDRLGYRLPTEAEWEFACRAGARTLHAFGDDSALLVHFANAPGPSREAGESEGARPVAVGLPNDLGLFDMHGNVQEWCHDRFVFFRTLGPFKVRVTRQGRESLDDQPLRVIRGGWYESAAKNLSCAGRRRSQAETSSRGLGFRIARTVQPR